jgi:putative hydrolase of the HAD superfamily
MANVTLLLWDVGGVLLSNGWDYAARAAAAAHFELDPKELERRHQLVDAAFETGRLDAPGYLKATVFYAPRPFSPETYLQFMRDRSRLKPAALDAARAVRGDGRYVMAALNNESRELNEYRIRTFGLKEVFHIFFSSCYTGLRKPEPAAFQNALTLTQRTPDETLFLDDRPENIAAAARLGLRTLQVRDPEHLGEELVLAGVASG